LQAVLGSALVLNTESRSFGDGLDVVWERQGFVCFVLTGALEEWCYHFQRQGDSVEQAGEIGSLILVTFEMPSTPPIGYVDI
jgi:hypothetical protein